MLGIHEGLNHPPKSNVEENPPRLTSTIQSSRETSGRDCHDTADPFKLLRAMLRSSPPRQPLHSVPSSPELAQKQSTMHGAPWISMTTPSSAKPSAPSPTPQQGSRSTPEPPEHSTFPTASKAIGSTDRTHPTSFALTAGITSDGVQRLGLRPAGKPALTVHSDQRSAANHTPASSSRWPVAIPFTITPAKASAPMADGNNSSE